MYLLLILIHPSDGIVVRVPRFASHKITFFGEVVELPDNTHVVDILPVPNMRLHVFQRQCLTVLNVVAPRTIIVKHRPEHGSLSDPLMHTASFLA